MKVSAAVDEQGRLILPPEIARHLQAGQTVVLQLDVTTLEDNPFTAFIGLLPPLEVDSLTHYQRERGHEE